MGRNDTVAKVQQTATALAERVRDAKLDERAAELAALAREKVKDAELDAKASELAATVRQLAHDAGVDDLVARARSTAVGQQATETAAHVAGTARQATDRTLDRVGEWLGEAEVGRRMGLRRRRRAKPWALVFAGAMAAGVAAGVAVMRRRQQAAVDIWGTDMDGATAAGPGAGPLDARVRDAIGSDPRTATLPGLNVNVVEGTVFVRGSVPAEVDQQALRTVIEGVEGVADVDLQVTVSA